MNKKSILLVEDDAAIQKLICQILDKEGYKVKAAKTLQSARKILPDFLPALIILDRRLPDGDGLDFCKEIKSSAQAAAPSVLFLTSKNSTSDKVLGLKMGGDDYLTKPFQVDELLARIEVLLRRFSQDSAQQKGLAVAAIELDIEKHICLTDGKETPLWPKEFELLRVFMERPGKVLSKEFISQQVWGHEFFDSSRALEMSIRRLRLKLGRKGKLIETVKGYGFKLRDK